MSVKKIVNRDGSIKWEVYLRATAQGEARIRRRFDKKIDAQNFLFEFNKRKKEIVSCDYQKVTTDFEATTFNVEADYWLEMKSSEFSNGYFRVLSPGLKIIRTLYGNYPIARFTSTLLFEFRKFLQRKELSVSTQNRYVDIIVRIINFSFTQKRINQNPCIGYKKQKEISEEMSFWSEEDVFKFLDFINKRYPKGTELRWIYLAYLFVLETGIRARELWGVKVLDIPQDGSKLKISRQVIGVNEFSVTKGKDFRNVPFSESLRNEILDWIKFSNLRSEQTVFVTKAQTNIDHDNFYDRIFKKDLLASGLREIRFHDLRHTALTMMVKRGIRIDVVQKIAGHKDIKTTMRYIHVLGRDIEEVGENFSLHQEIKREINREKPSLKIV